MKSKEHSLCEMGSLYVLSVGTREGQGDTVLRVLEISGKSYRMDCPDTDFRPQAKNGGS